MLLDRKDCKFDPQSGILTVKKPDGPFPEIIHFPGTAGILTFSQDTELAMKNEFWDGMATAYLPSLPIPRLSILMMVVPELF
jgi:hypothetical protein